MADIFRFEQITGGDITTDPPTATLRYRATGAPASLPSGDYFSWIASYALANTDPTYVHPRGLIFRQDLQIHENWYARHYDIVVPYGRQKKQAGAYQISVDQTGGTVHVTAGTRIAGYGPAADAVDNGGLIGVDGDNVNGTDIEVEDSKINVMFRHPQGVLTRAYVRAVGRLVGFPNSDSFLGYDPGEVKYLGGQFTETDTEATAQYSFAISYNRTNFSVGGITITEKKGWDVISPVYKDDVDGGNPVRRLAYIEIIRPAGREWTAYGPVFGWGGT